MDGGDLRTHRVFLFSYPTGSRGGDIGGSPSMPPPCQSKGLLLPGCFLLLLSLSVYSALLLICPSLLSCCVHLLCLVVLLLMVNHRGLLMALIFLWLYLLLLVVLFHLAKVLPKQVNCSARFTAAMLATMHSSLRSRRLGCLIAASRSLRRCWLLLAPRVEKHGRVVCLS